MICSQQLIQAARMPELHRALPHVTGRGLVMGASGTPQEISVSAPVQPHVASDDIALRVDPVALCGNGTGNVYGDVVSVAQDHTVLVSILTVVEPNDVTIGVNTGPIRKDLAKNSNSRNNR
jgi:hypothetical protein